MVKSFLNHFFKRLDFSTILNYLGVIFPEAGAIELPFNVWFRVVRDQELASE